MYKYIGVAILSVAAIMLLPMQSQAEETSGLFWGLAHVVVLDINGEEIMSQSIHNALVNEGETFIVNNVFKDGALAEAVDTDLIGSICLTDDGAFSGTGNAVPEGHTALIFDTAISGTLNAATVCIDDDDVDTSTQGNPKIGALTFTYGTNTPGTGSHTITMIGICQGEGAGAEASFGDCQAAQATDSGKLFAAIDIADFTLATSGETAQIDYSFDITTGSS
jgi:hypothetical protein